MSYVRRRRKQEPEQARGNAGGTYFSELRKPEKGIVPPGIRLRQPARKKEMKLVLQSSRQEEDTLQKMACRI